MQLLVTEGLELVKVLVDSIQMEEMNEVSSSIMSLFEFYKQEQRLILWAIQKEIQATSKYKCCGVMRKKSQA